MLSRIVSLVRLARHPRRSLLLATENEDLKARLSKLEEQARLSPPEASTGEAETRYRERRALILIPQLMGLLNADDTFLIVDAGAREVDQDPRWRSFPVERMTFVGFEPDKGEAERLDALPTASGARRRFVAAGLWSTSGVQEFEHNNIGGGSSFLPQNRKVTDRWKFENPGETKNASKIFFPVRREVIEVVSLQDWAAAAQMGKIDFLKLNVQ
jgi:hypothetical protein